MKKIMGAWAKFFVFFFSFKLAQQFVRSKAMAYNGLRIKDVKNAIVEMFNLAIMFVAFFISFNTLLYAGTASLVGISIGER